MNSRVVAVFAGVFALFVACIIVWNSQKEPETATSAKPVSESASRQGSAGNSRNGESTRARRPSMTNRSSGVAADQAEQEISRLLSDDKIPLRQASEKLLAIAADPTMVKEMRAEALGHALNLVSDEEFPEMVLPYLEENFFEDPEMQRVALDNAYNREDVAKLPAALALMRHGQGDLRIEARDLLEFILEQDGEALGDNFDAWSNAITNHLNRPQE